MIKSFYATYYSVDGGTLIGGVSNSQTCRYQVRSEAEQRLKDVVDINGGESVCKGEMHESVLPPEIFRHCHPKVSQSVGASCFRCGKVLTSKDAKDSKPIG